MDRNLKRAFLGSLVLVLISITALFLKINDLRAELLMSISGKVIDYDTGKGIPNIAVIVNPYHWTKTDKDGNFIISDLPAGRYTFDIPYMVSTIPEYYVPYKYPEVVEVPRGKNVTNIKIYLRKGGEASGRVLAEDGVTPIKGAWVEIVSHETDFYADISALFSHSGTIKSRAVFLTDEQGRFKLKGLLEGFSFDILVMAYGYADEWRKGLRVKYGEELNIGDIIVGRRSKSVIRGKVYSSTDMTPIVGAEVWINKMPLEKEQDGGWALTDSKGEFQVKGLTHGYYRISVAISKEDWKKYWNPLSIFDFYISEGKENYVEIKVNPKEEREQSSKIENIREETLIEKIFNRILTNSHIKSEFVRASLFPVFPLFMLGGPTIDSSCGCVNGGPNVFHIKGACNTINNSSPDVSKLLTGCPKVPNQCHKDNCDKEKPEYKIKCQNCSSTYEDGTRVPLCGYTIRKCEGNKVLEKEINICFYGAGQPRPTDCQSISLTESLAHEMLHLCDCQLIEKNCREACAYCTIMSIYGDRASSITVRGCEHYIKVCPSVH